MLQLQRIVITNCVCVCGAGEGDCNFQTRFSIRPGAAGVALIRTVCMEAGETPAALQLSEATTDFIAGESPVPRRHRRPLQLAKPPCSPFLP